MSRVSDRRCAGPVVGLTAVVWCLAMASAAVAQTGGPTSRFVLGPLGWTPTLMLRDAGIDSNVFNTQNGSREDVTASVMPSVDSLLSLGVARVATRADAEYVYFKRYTQERAFNRRVSSRILLPFNRIQPALTVSWARVTERASSEVDVRAPRTDVGYGGALTTRVTPGLSLSVGLDTLRTAYDFGRTFRGVDVAAQLNHRTTSARAGLRAAVSPFTGVYLETEASRDEFTVQPARDTDNLRGGLGLEFARDAIISGRAQVGYHRMMPRHGSGDAAAAVPFAGLTSSVDLSYTMFGRTRISPRFGRDTTYSISTAQPYYLSTATGLEILHELFGPIELVARGGHEKLGYPATAFSAARTDFLDTYTGGLSIRISSQGRVGVNYENAKRRSNGGAEFGYARRRLYTTVTYGF